MSLTAPAPVRARPSQSPDSVQAAWHALDEPEALSLEADAGPGRLRLLWRQIADPLIYALLASAALALAFGDLVDGAVVLAVVALNALIGYGQEAKAADAIRSLDALVADRARVRRDNAEIEVRPDDLVPGDVVRVEAGDKVPADARLLEVAALTVDAAPLTGESVPVARPPRRSTPTPRWRTAATCCTAARWSQPARRPASSSAPGWTPSSAASRHYWPPPPRSRPR
jgi:magnesium-transporting ATPase (P-type)